MPTKKAPMPTSDTFTDLLLALTAVSGELPTSLISRIPGALSYKQKMVTRIKKDNLLSVYSCNGLRGFRLTGKGKRYLLERRPERYRTLFSGDSTLNAPKYTVTHRTRLCRMAEVLVTMLNTDVLMFPWEKPMLRQPNESPHDLVLERPAYYSSLEVKDIGPQGMKIRGSRATGVLFSEQTLYAVYNTGSADMRWDNRAETRLKALMQTELSRYALQGGTKPHELQAILFASDMNCLERLLADADGESGKSDPGGHERRDTDKAAKARTGYFLLYGSYEHVHLLTNDRKGELVLRFLTDTFAKSALDALLMQDLNAADRTSGMDYDAVEKNGRPVLFGYTADLPRIARFAKALDYREKKGMVICFDFQKVALETLCGEHITFQCMDLEAVEETFFD